MGQKSNNTLSYLETNTYRRSAFSCFAVIVSCIIAVFFVFAGIGVLNNRTTTSVLAETESAGDTTTTTSDLPDGATSWTDVYSASLSSDSSYYIINGLQSSFSSLTTIDIPNTINDIPVKEISANAFKGKTSITSLTIPKNITTIGTYAFYNCLDLTEINYNAVECSDLVSTAYVFDGAGTSGAGITVTIGKGVTKVPAYLFFPYSSTTASPKITSVVFEEGSVCTSIGSYSFAYCPGSLSLTIPDSVTTIGDGAFFECTGLTGVYITDMSAWCKITFAGETANPLCYAKKLYLNNELVTNLTIPEDITEIKPYAFENCTSLTSLIIPEGITTIGEGAFGYCSALTAIDFNATACNDFSSSDGVFNNAGCSSDTGITFTIGKEVTKVPAYLCYPTVSIDFSPVITSVVFEEGSVCTSIGEWAFLDCAEITSLTIPDKVTTIGKYAFSGCNGLASLTIGSGVTTIGNNAFEACIALTEINFNAIECDDLTSNNGVFYNAGRKSSTGITVKFGKDVTKVPAYLFYSTEKVDYLPNITSVLFEDNSKCESIGSYAFGYCTGLTSLTIPDSVTTIGAGAFFNCFTLVSLTIPDKVETIGAGAFNGCTGMTSLTIGKGVTTIDGWAFGGCTALTEINFNAVECGDLFYFGVFDYAGQSDTGITLTIGKDVTRVPGSLFMPSESYANITSVVFEEGSVCTSIGMYAFAGCSELSRIDMGEKITTIGDYAFYYCTALTEITLPKSVTSIGKAFNGLTGIVLHIEGSVKDGEREVPLQLVSKDALSEAIVYVSNADLSTYRSAPYYTNTAVVASLRASTWELTMVFNVYNGDDVVTDSGSVDPNSTGVLQEIKNILANPIDFLTNLSITRTGYEPEGFYASSNMLDSEKVTSVDDFYKDTTIYLRWKYTGIDWDSLYEITESDGKVTITGLKEKNAIGVVAFEMSDRVTEIGTWAFFSNELEYARIQSVKIGKNVKTIGPLAFYLCINLSSLSFEGNDVLESMGSSAFGNCAIKGELALPSSILESGVGGSWFANPGGYGSNAITKFTVIGDTGNIIATSEGLILTADGTKVLLAPNILPSNIVLSDKVVSIYQYAFEGVSGLEGISGKNVVEVGRTAFNGCSLSYFDFPNLETFGHFAFANCSNLVTVKLGSKVSTIGANAFTGCDNLRTIVVEGSIGSSERTAIPTIIFSDSYFMIDNPESVSVYVNSDDLSFYQADEAWSRFSLVGVQNEKVCTVTINLDGGEGYSSIYYILYGHSIDLSTMPTKEGYTFVRWEKKDGENWVGFDYTTIITEDTSIRVVWEIIDYKIIYHLNGGVIGENTGNTFTQTFRISNFGSNKDISIELAEITKEGYTFVGWYSKEDFDSARVTGILYNTLTIAQINAIEDIHLYARWDIITYTMTFEESDAYTITLDNTTLNPVPWNSNFGFVIVLSDAYTQNTAENIVVKIVSGSGETEELSPIGDDIRGLSLHYIISNVTQAYTIKVEGLSKNVYSVYFETKLDGVEGLPATKKIVHGESIDKSTITDPTVAGYTFIGYYLRVANGEEEKYSTTAFDFDSIITNDITLLADFEAIEYTVTLILNGGKINGAERESFELKYTVERGIMLPSSSSEEYRIERVGYTFGGWHELTDEEEIGSAIEKYDIGTTGNKKVTLQWNIVTYHIRYVYNNGAHENTPIDIFTVEESVTLTSPIRRGYTFEGWYTDIGMIYNRIENIPEGTASDVTVYAKWSSIQYNIYYHLNGSQYTSVEIDGVVPSNTNTYTHIYVYDEKSTYTLLVPTRKGYTFAGWFENSELTGNAIVSMPGSEIIENKNYYAKWTAMEYTITFDYGDIYTAGEDDDESITLTTQDIEDAGNRYPLGHELTKEGYTFLGWFADDEKVEYLTLDNIKNMTLSANFRINKMNVTLLGDNVSGNVTILSGDKAITSVEWGKDLVFRVSIVNLEYSKSNYSVSYSYTSDGEYTSLSESNGNYTIPSVQQDVFIKIDGIVKNTYTIEFISNGGSLISAMENIPHGNTISEPTKPTRDGYTFVGWFSDMGLQTSFNFDSAITSDLHLYAKWESVKHTAVLKNNINDTTKSIEFDISNQGSISLLENNFTISGYQFLGFYLVPDNSDDYSSYDDSDLIENLNNIHRDCVIMARFEIIEYNIYYGIDAGENNANNPSTYTVLSENIILQHASKTNYKFVRWEKVDTKETIAQISTGSTGDVFVVAIFELISDDYATIKYYASGEFYSEVAVKKGESIAMTSSAQISPKVIEGYRFVNWFADETYGVVFDLSTVIESATNLYGKYEKVPYTITYTSNVGDFTNSDDNLTIVDIESRFNLIDPSKNGYQFAGWYTGVVIDGDNYDFSNAEKIVAISNQVGDITLVARFNLITYSITYDLVGGDMESGVVGYTVLDDTINLPSPSKVGYTFLYWMDESGNQIDSINPNICRNITLTAKYNKNKYVITYVDDKTTTDNTTEYYVDTLGFVPKHNDVLGYNFLGWFNGDSKIETLAGGQVGDMTLTARYEIIEYHITYALDGGYVESENPTTYTIESGVNRFNSPSKLGGWSFRYWMNVDTEEEVSSIAIGSTGDIILQAIYERIENYVQITYYVNGKRYQVDSVESGKTVNDIVVEKEHYEFVGWYSNAELTIPYETSTAVTSDMQLYAKFTPIVYSISYTFVDGNGNTLSGVINSNASVFSVESLVGFDTPIKPGYVFAGFTLDGDRISTTFGIYKDITVVGLFNIQYYNISYFLDGGRANNPGVYTINDDDITLNDAIKDGYIFLGWYDSVTDEKITTIDTSSLKDYTLIAKWQSKAKPSTNTPSTNDDTNVLLTAIFVVLAICAFIGVVGGVNVIRKRRIEKSNNTQLKNMWSRVETTTRIKATRPNDEKDNVPNITTKEEKAEPFVMPTESSSISNEGVSDASSTIEGEQSGQIEAKNNIGKITPLTIERNRPPMDSSDEHSDEE